MTNFRTLLAAALVVGLFATVASAGIVGSAHDFASYNWSGGQTCQPCHTPHGGSDATTGGPLWNHQVGTNPNYTYNTYDDTGTATADNTKLDPNTMLCMSCHDGTIALDSFGGAVGTNYIPAGAKIGKAAPTGATTAADLTGNHPLGSAGAYPTTDGLTSTASYMVNPWQFYGFTSATDTTPVANSRGLTLGHLKPLDGKFVVGCTTCHEPHNRYGYDPLLRIRQNVGLTTLDGRTVNGSGLCLTCHKK